MGDARHSTVSRALVNAPLPSVQFGPWGWNCLTGHPEILGSPERSVTWAARVDNDER